MIAIKFTSHAWDEYLTLQTDKALLKRLNLLIRDTQRDPFDGLGKPEPLKNNLSGLWSRRITDEHRLVYTVRDETLLIVQCRHHY